MAIKRVDSLGRGTSEQELRRLEQRFPEGFIFKTGQGEFQFTPGEETKFERTRFGREISPAFRRVPVRQFTRRPIIMSSDRARERFQKNLEKLQRFEQRFSNVGSTPAFAPEKQKPNLRGVT